MAQLAPITIDEKTTIYIEAADNLNAPMSPQREVYDPTATRSSGLTPKNAAMTEKIAQNVQAIETTIRTYTTHVLNAFKDAALANVDAVKLEFGISVSGEAGIPYITKGEVASNLKITVECSFPKK